MDSPLLRRQIKPAIFFLQAIEVYLKLHYQKCPMIITCKKLYTVHVQTRHSPVISVQAVNKFRKDARFDQVINRRVTVTGQQLPANTVIKTTHQHTLPAWECKLYAFFNKLNICGCRDQFK